MLKYWIGFLIATISTLALAAEERVQVEPLSGLPQTQHIASPASSGQRSAMEIWLSDSVRYLNFIRPSTFYVSSRQWLEFAAQYETEEFGSKFRGNAEYVKKAEQEFQEAIKTGGVAEKILKEGKLILYYPANYASLADKPALPELFLNAIVNMGKGYSWPQTNDCGQEYGCQMIIHFVPGSLETDTIEVSRE